MNLLVTLFIEITRFQIHNTSVVVETMKITELSSEITRSQHEEVEIQNGKSFEIGDIELSFWFTYEIFVINMPL